MATPKKDELKATADAAKALEVATDELDSAQRRGIATQKELLEIQVKIAEAALNNAIAEGKLGRELDSFRVIVESTRKAVEDYTTAQEELADAAAAGELAFNQLAGSVLQLNGPLGRLSGLLDGNGKSFGKFIASAKDSIKSGELLKNTVLKLVDANLKFALRQNEAIAGFRAATGAGAEFNEVIRQTERATFAAGVTVNDSTAAITSLKNEGQQRGLKNNTVLLQKMGFSFSTQTAIIQNSSQAMGMSLDESQALLLDIASTARSLGMDIDTLGQSFNTNIEFITRFGSDGQKVFEELAVSAKALGTDIDTLVSVVDKFKTFDGAATHVGRLNAILGGPFLNSIDMMNAAFEDPIEGINLLRDGFDAAGRSIEDISGAELEAIASAMGMSLSETKKILGKSNEEMEIYRLNQSDLAEQAMVTQSITEQLTATFGQFYANLGPIIDHILVPMVTWLGGVAQSIGDIINTIPSFVAGLGMAGAAVGALIGLSLGLTAAIPGVGIAMAATSAAAVLGYVALGTALGGGVGAIAGSLFSQPEGTGKTKSMTPQYATGGVVTGTTTAIVGENGPEMVEMPTGSRVTTAPATKQLTDAIMKLSNKLDNVGGGENIQLAVYIGKEKVDEIVVNAINSRAGRAAFSPFSNA